MSPRARILPFGSAGALVLAGIVCAVLVEGLTGELLTIVLISLGLGGAVLLVFLEIGLGEERDLARDEERKRAQRGGPLGIPRLRRAPRRRRPG